MTSIDIVESRLREITDAEGFVIGRFDVDRRQRDIACPEHGTIEQRRTYVLTVEVIERTATEAPHVTAAKARREVEALQREALNLATVNANLEKRNAELREAQRALKEAKP